MSAASERARTLLYLSSNVNLATQDHERAAVAFAEATIAVSEEATRITREQLRTAAVALTRATDTYNQAKRPTKPAKVKR